MSKPNTDSTKVTVSDFVNPMRLVANFGPRRRVGSGRLRGWIIITKIALPTVAFLLLLLIVIWPIFKDSGLNYLTHEMRDFVNSAQGRLKIERASLVMFDAKGQAFHITADDVQQNSQNQDLVGLQGPRADIELSQQGWAYISANQGKLDRKAQILSLEGKVSIYQDRGFEMHGESMQVHYAEGEVHTDKPVEGLSANALYHAAGFSLEDRGNIIRLLGKSKIIMQVTH